jgi:hypothetical protein
MYTTFYFIMVRGSFFNELCYHLIPWVGCDIGVFIDISCMLYGVDAV